MSEPYYRDEPYLMIKGGQTAFPWSLETMTFINKLTPDVTSKAFDPDWFMLRQRFETYESKLITLETRNRQLVQAMGEKDAEIARLKDNFSKCQTCGKARSDYCSTCEHDWQT